MPPDLSRHTGGSYHLVMSAVEHAQLVLQLARDAGFERSGIAGVGPIIRASYFDQWLETGLAGEMDYLARYRPLRLNRGSLLAGARSILVVADNYHQGPWPEADDSDARGKVARYAWGRDYHRVLRKKLQRLADAMHEAIDADFRTRVCVDTAPLIEREAAAAAGVGWIGKNTMVLHEELGSFFFLGEIVTTLDLQPGEPVTDRCGTCTRCLDACPTNALHTPYQMDARRCISYLTIEHRSEIDSELQTGMEDWFYGCDMCQDVCPYNRKAPITKEPAYEATEHNPLTPTANLHEVERWTECDYREELAGSAMKRAKLEMLHRNARIVRLNVDKVQAPEQQKRATTAEGDGSD
jgi:epoxyqueuosine reductase